MDGHSLVILLSLVAVIAAILVAVVRRARREQAQGRLEDEAPPHQSHRLPGSGTPVKVKTVEGGGLWEPWASVPPPRVESEARPDRTEQAEAPTDAKSDVKAR